MVPTLSASGSVGEGRVEGSGGERRGCGRTPLSRGECGQQERERQGLPRPSGPRFAGYTAKNRRDDAQRSVGWFVIGYFSNVKQVTRERKNVDITGVCSHHFLPPHSSACAINKAEKSNTASWISDRATFGNQDHTGSKGLESCVIASPLGGLWSCLWSESFSQNLFSSLLFSSLLSDLWMWIYPLWIMARFIQAS